MTLASSAAEAPQLLDDVEYAIAGGVSLRMDASLPQAREPSAAVIIVHGGGWVTGDRKLNVEPLFQPLSDAGFAWFSISYRLTTNVSQFGVAIDDVQSAVRFVKAHAAEYHIDPNRIALLGESAGGQLAAMAVLRGDPGVTVRAVVALYTPTDLVALAKTSDYIPKSIRDSVRGTPWEGVVLAGLSQLSPINHVQNGMPPFLFVHGTNDALVPFEQSVQMCDRMRRIGASCEVLPVEGGGHGIRWWEAYPQLAAAYKRKMLGWLQTQLAPSSVKS